MSKLNEMERKVTKFGNSLGITMTDVLKQLGLEAGIRYGLMFIKRWRRKTATYWNQPSYVHNHQLLAMCLSETV